MLICWKRCPCFTDEYFRLIVGGDSLFRPQPLGQVSYRANQEQTFVRLQKTQTNLYRDLAAILALSKQFQARAHRPNVGDFA